MRTGRLSPSWFTEPEMARLTGGHEAHRAARTAVSSRQRNFHRVQGAAIDRVSPPRMIVMARDEVRYRVATAGPRHRKKRLTERIRCGIT
jgi:hypothetical protein